MNYTTCFAGNLLKKGELKNFNLKSVTDLN